MGLEKAKEHPDKVKADDLITLRRIIYQSMLQAFHHGRIIDDPFAKTSSLEPNLDLVPKVNDAYLQLYAEETQPNQKNGISESPPEFSEGRGLFSLRKQPHGRRRQVV